MPIGAKATGSPSEAMGLGIVESMAHEPRGLSRGISPQARYTLVMAGVMLPTGTGTGTVGPAIAISRAAVPTVLQASPTTGLTASRAGLISSGSTPGPAEAGDSGASTPASAEVA